MKRQAATALAAALILAPALVLPGHAAERYITVASTTSTEQSGLFGHILPLFTQATGIDARVVALGTGQALDIGRRGDADVVFVHDTAAEMKFIAEGFGVDRREVMFNDFVLVGSNSDPAKIGGLRDVAIALQRIAVAKVFFASRGDKSGTHAAEIRLWQIAGIDIAAEKGPWYRETGSGMGPTLNTAAAMNAYAFTDRGTWLSFRNRAELVILAEGDVRLFNQYGVMLVNPAKHPHVKRDDAMAFVDWVTSPAGQRAIADYKLGGEQLFFPNYRKAGS